MIIDRKVGRLTPLCRNCRVCHSCGCC